MSIGSVVILNGCKCCLFVRVSGFMGRESIGVQEKEGKKKKRLKRVQEREEREKTFLYPRISHHHFNHPLSHLYSSDHLTN